MMRGRLTEIIERWFISEPVLFQVMCLHEVTENASMPCPVRSGRRRIEYNPAFVREMGDSALEQALRTEAVRILLKHPYQRRPDACSAEAVAAGSDITVSDNYHYVNYNIDRPSDYGLPSGEAYEWYSRRIQEMLPPPSGGSTSGSGDDCSDRLAASSARHSAQSELWQEDELTAILIDGIIDRARDWGSLAGSLAEKLKASTRSRINWRHVLGGFRASILSTRRRLTRMRPNRRTGFDNMGSIRRYTTRLLVAVDVSGSISSSDLSYFYGVINSAFRYGFTAVDVVQFDAGVRVVQSLRKVMREVIALGRGGTSFQEPIEYAAERGYDGLVMLTDGFAPEPLVPEHFRNRIVWVCRDRTSYNRCHHWMEKSGRVCIMELK